MGVKLGYKRTDLGEIPVEWETVRLSAISEFITKGSTPTTYGFGWQRSGVLFLRSECVSPQGLDLSQSMYISAGAHRSLRRSAVQPNDLLITITGNVGRVVRVPEHLEEANINQHIARVRIIDEETDSGWVYHFLSQPGTRRGFERITTGQAYPQISLVQVRDALIPRPPIAEQRAVAAALSDLEALLEGLDRLIAKKRDLKQAAMQELLSGRTRLPGFGGEWASKTIGDIVESIVGGGTPSRAQPSFWGGDVPWVTVKDFASFDPTKTQESITYAGVQNSATHLIPARTLIVATRIALGKAVAYDIEVAINQDLKALFLRSDVDLRFMLLWFAQFGHEIAALGSGSTVMGIALGELCRFALQVPALDEQVAIADALDAMDKEIAVLEMRCDKTRALKQAVMQALLTGRVRLQDLEKEEKKR